MSRRKEVGGQLFTIKFTKMKKLKFVGVLEGKKNSL
jgi:hypothetical protein